jgi:hypothetical protein
MDKQFEDAEEVERDERDEWLYEQPRLRTEAGLRATLIITRSNRG